MSRVGCGDAWVCVRVLYVPEVLTKVEAALASASTLRQPSPDKPPLIFLRTLSFIISFAVSRRLRGKFVCKVSK